MSTELTQNAALFVQESIAVSSPDVADFNHLIAARMKDGWIPFGQMFAVGDCYTINMVKIDKRVTGMLDKAMDLLTQQLEDC